VSATVELAVGLGGVFVGLVILLGTVGAFTGESQRVGRSLAAIRALDALPVELREAAPGFDERVLRPMYGRLTRLGRRFTPTGHSASIQRRLDIAGNPWNWDVDRVLALKVLGLLGLGLLGLALPLEAGLSPITVVLTTVVGLVLGFFVPDLTIYQLGAKRTDKMRKTLPDALDMLSISVEAGLGFDAALAQLARNTEGPVAAEFFRVLQEMQIGLGRAQAMRALGARSNLPELKSFVTSMVQADAFGIPVADVLRVQASEMRLKRSQRAEEAAQKVPVKILFPLIFCIMPAMFVVIIGPAAIEIAHNLLGRHT
jgi:tight adherence protein C